MARSRFTNRLFRFPATAEGRRCRDLLDDFVAALGGRSAITMAQLTDARRAAELTLLAERARAQALAAGSGVVDAAALVKLEGAADRAQRRLRLKPVAAKPKTLGDHLARLTGQGGGAAAAGDR